MFRAAATRDKHSRSSCPVKLTCVNCRAEFSSKQRLASHVKRCDVEQVATSTSRLPGSVLAPSTSPPPADVLAPSGNSLAPCKSPQPSTSSAPPALPPGGLPLLCPGGDYMSAGGLEQETQYSVTINNELPACDQQSGLKLFDLNTYLQGGIDLDTLLDD